MSNQLQTATHRDGLERERIQLLLVDDARLGLADIEAGRTFEADATLAQLQQRRSLAAPADATRQKSAAADELPTSVAEDGFRADLTASFLDHLEAIEANLTEADAGFAFDELLAELRATAISTGPGFPVSAGAT
jgi:hypothetical protein